MTYEILITEQAEADLRGIYNYIALELLAPDNASGQLDRLEHSIIALQQFPEKFRCYEKEPWHSRNLHVMPVDNYLVFYILNKDTQTVTIIRVMYDGRNTDEQLVKNTEI